MAFANRSAAHFDCGNFEAAITGKKHYLMKDYKIKEFLMSSFEVVLIGSNA